MGNQEVAVFLLPSIAGYIERAVGYYQEAGKNGLAQYTALARWAEYVCPHNYVRLTDTETVRQAHPIFKIGNRADCMWCDKPLIVKWVIDDAYPQPEKEPSA